MCAKLSKYDDDDDDDNDDDDLGLAALLTFHLPVTQYVQT